MATKKVTPVRKPQYKAPVVSSKSKFAPDSPVDFVFDRMNYIWMLVGILFIVVGFLLMIGGGSNDPNVWNPAIFSFRRITLAPVLVMIGYGIEVYAILRKPKEAANSGNTNKDK